MNKLATIQKIHSIQPHPNADNLSVAKVMEWPVVIKKDQFKEGELIIFVEIDSIVPETEYFEFMRKQKFRVWNARFRGYPSSGLVCPLSILPERSAFDSDGNEREILYEEGDDVSEILQIKKYERPIDITIGGDDIGGFPTNLISITDEDNALSYPEAFSEISDGQELYITLKNDGSSTTFIFNNGEFSACSRRLMMKENSGFVWAEANKYNLREKMISIGKNIAIQCEAVGPKLNGNRLGLKDIELRLFRAKNLDTRELYNYNELKELSYTLIIPIVEEIEVIKYNKNIHTIGWFRNLTDNQVWPTNGQPAEGVVVAPVNPFYSNTLGKMWSLKIINSNYKQS